MTLSRRRLLLAGSSAVVVAGAAALAEPRVRSRADRLLHGTPHAAYAQPRATPGPVTAGSFRSVARRAVTGWVIGYPPGSRPGDPLPFLLVLHGRGDDSRAVLGSHRLGAYLADAVRRGTPPYAVVGVDGGDHDYWHRRSSGADPQAMVVTELLPLLAARGLRTARFAVGGWSMGGYGALLLAERLGPARVATVAVDSPALWSRSRDTAPGAFDGPADFAAHDVLTATAGLAGIPVRVSCGSADPFLPGVRALLREVPAAQREIGAGAHDLAWWRHAAPAQLAFVGAHLPA